MGAAVSQLTCAMGLFALLALICATRSHDPFGRDKVRAVLFIGFARERIWAIGLTAVVCLGALAMALGQTPGLRALQVVFGIYCIVGALPLIASATTYPSQRRDADPCLRALTLALLWPIRM